MALSKSTKKVVKKKATVKKSNATKTSKSSVSKKPTANISSSTNLASPVASISDGSLNEAMQVSSQQALANLNKAGRGEFRGDFTRDTFDLHNRFSRVLMQQGRVQLDADWNEQSSIMLHYLRNLACDVGSEHWGPNQNAGFKISLAEGVNGEPQIRIGTGHYYVNGILCEADLTDDGVEHNYSNQPDYPLPEGQSIQELESQIVAGQISALVYLDVWERHFTYVNDDSMREVALGGPDTATRSKVIWQVKILPIPFESTPPNGGPNHLKVSYTDFLNAIDPEIKPGKGKLCAKVKDKTNDNDPCLIAPESRFRGAENQLYRVEIHNSGFVEESAANLKLAPATYKWSRENASVIFPIVAIQGSIISLEHLGKDCRYGLKPNDWVELIDDDHVLQCRADVLFQVESIDKQNRQVTLSGASSSSIEIDVNKHAYLRRWDHVDGDENGIAVVEGADGAKWLDLEDGIQVRFDGGNQAGLTDANGNLIESSASYKTGDYWLIPARTITADIEWPTDEGEPQCLLPHGVVHHYAPLAILNKGEDTNGDGQGNGEENIDLRRILIQTWA